MRSRILKWFVLCLLCVAGAWFLWHETGQRTAKEKAAATAASAAPGSLTGAAPLTNPALVSAAAAKTNRLAYRLSNTTRSIGQLTGDRRAILLENALIDSSLPLNFSIPKNLQAQGDPGAYIVQARGPINAAFRALLARAGAEIISYIPNDAYLVRVTAGGAGGLAAQPPVQSVIPYEPYYKIQSALLGAAVNQSSLPAGAVLNLGLFAAGAPQTIQQIEQLGGRILARDTSPFGPVVRVQPPANWTALAALPGVQIVERFHPRVPANDLSRVTVGVAVNTLTNVNYLGLSGSNVVVDVNDTGIDATHPDFTTGGNPTTAGGTPIRVVGDAVQSLVDTNGHGTHVAGIIAGNGAKSLTTMSNGVQLVEGSATNADFRGKAPLATLYSVAGIIGGADPYATSDQYLQEQAALTNAPISNNSWGYGDNGYDLAAASYDAATRDALPEVTGSQPVLFVFAAGNDGNIGQNGGNGDDNGGGGTADTISSPGTAKNVITVGALEQLRNITNIVTNLDKSVSTPWQPQTDTGYQVAGYSSRGNVGIGIEGASGRFKPDVAAPGTFVVSTSSQFNKQWATNAYYNPTNHDDNTYTSQSVGVNGLNYYSIFVPQNAVSVTVQIQANKNSPNPFPTNLPIYVSQYNYPDPTDNSTYDFVTTDDEVLIPPDGPGDYLTTIQGTGFNFAVGNTNSQTVSYNLFTEVATTNDLGNYYQVLEGMNDSLGGYYRYESGTSMAAADVSGTLALMEDFFVNHSSLTNPSPALLKAMLINGARPTAPLYTLQVNKTINYEGWGLISLPNSLPLCIQTNFNGTVPSSIFLQDQSPTNALATGDRHTFTVSVSTNASALSLRLTLAWTDPPGDPVAAIKLVNRLELVVTNLDDPTNPIVYYGNDIPLNGYFNTPENPTNPVVVDSINNVQSVIIPQPPGSNYTVTVFGREVNVNAVSAQTNSYNNANPSGVYAPNVVQDYALVISCGGSGAPAAFTVTDNGILSNPTGSQDLTVVTTTNSPLFNQFVGASSPVLNTNTVSFTANTTYGGAAQDTLGMTNQWHFYIVTNNALDSSGSSLDVTNAVFIIFTPPTLSIPRMGVFADSVTNATMPQANIDLFVASGPTASGLTNLDPVVISNCINEVGDEITPGAPVNNASLARGGAKFVVFSNSTPGQVYYVGVKSEDEMASEYSFLPIFTAIPPSQMNPNGDEILNGMPIPSGIPGGTPSVPGFTDVVAIAIEPIQVERVIVTSTIDQLNVGDLVSSLSFNNTSVVLMNHDSPNVPGPFTYVYDDSGTVDPTTLPAGDTLQRSDGPGSLQNFVGQNASSGVWVFHVANSVAPFTGSVSDFSLLVQPQVPLTSGVTNIIPPHGWAYDSVDVPAGATNLTINATNVASTMPTTTPDLANPPLMVLKLGSEPTLTDADKGPVALTNGTPPGNSLSVGPTDVPPIQPGRYWVGITNQSDTTQAVFVIAVILPANPNPKSMDFASAGVTQILDDAVTNSDIFVATNMPIVSVNVGIVAQHPRISDLVFHLVHKDTGTRALLMENRGGADTNGVGASVVITNIVNVSPNGNGAPNTNIINVGETTGTLPITYNFYNIPDQMTIYYGNDPATFYASSPFCITNTGFVNNGPIGGGATTPVTFTINFGPVGGVSSTYLTIIMNQFGVWNNGDYNSTAWTYTAGGVFTNYYYLMFTEDTNLTTTPIKFAPPPFVPSLITSSELADGFEQTPATNYAGGSTFGNGWTVITNQVSVVTDPTNACEGSNFLALANGVISNTLPTVAGQTYRLTFAYRGPGITAFWRGESNFNDSINTNNGTDSSGTVKFVPAEVGHGFNYDGSANNLAVPDLPDLNFGAGQDFSIDAWVQPNVDARLFPWVMDIVDKRYIPHPPTPNLGQSHGYEFCLINGVVACQISQSTAGGFSTYGPAGPDLRDGKFHHVAMTVSRESATGGTLYVDGQAVLTFDPTSQSGDLSNTNQLLIGNHPDPGVDGYFDGVIDEVSIYRRAISASEVLAIATNGSAGKFDPASAFPQNLAEAQVNLGNETPNTLYGSNTNWQTETVTFVATQDGTPLSIIGLEPGMLLDGFFLTQVPGNLYYQPEQSLDAFTGENAYGDWLLEVQDDRAGAGLTNSLVSWDLQFVFANTNAVPFVVRGGIGQSNQFIPAGGIAWYQINVPLTANFATNRLLFASAPVNVWFSTNVPPTITNSASGDIDLMPGSTVGSKLLSTANPPDGNLQLPPNIYQGQTYYLGVQNLNAFTVNYGIEVDFDHGNAPGHGLPLSVAASGSGTALNWTASPNAKFQMQWKNNLAAPWNTAPTVITSGDGNFSFTDDGSQTAPLGPMRFYRLMQISP
jgi:subtilisin-like proprotein convertase family protein